MNKIAILCDFDGTIAVDDVGNRLFRAFSDYGQTGAIVEQWKNGLISSRDCLEREVAMANATREELDEFIGTCRLDPYFKDFIDFTKKRGMEVARAEEPSVRTAIVDDDPRDQTDVAPLHRQCTPWTISVDDLAGRPVLGQWPTRDGAHGEVLAWFLGQAVDQRNPSAEVDPGPATTGAGQDPKVTPLCA